MTHEDIVIEHIRQHGPIEGNDVVVELENPPHSIPRTTTFAYLSSLAKSGRLGRSGKRRHYAYYVPSGKQKLTLNDGAKIRVKWDDGTTYDAEFRGSRDGQVEAFFPDDGETHSFPIAWMQL